MAKQGTQLLLSASKRTLVEGEGPIGDDVVALLEDAAAAGSPEAEYLCGIVHLYGSSSLDEEKARGCFERAAAAGQADAIYELGLGLEVRGAPRQEVLNMYSRGAEFGHLPCINGIRAQFRDSPDRAEFARWSEAAAGLGDAEAQYSMGSMYATGDGVEVDLARAMELYQQAAEQNFPMACHNLAVHFATGQGVEKDLAASAAWYRRGAELGLEKSCRTLAAMYFHGQGVEQDRAKAEEWMKEADAIAGEADAERAWNAQESLQRRYAKARDLIRTIAGRLEDARPPEAHEEKEPEARLSRSGEAQESEAPSLPPNLEAGFALSLAAQEAQTDWSEGEDGVLRGSKYVSAEGLGTFGLFSLSASLTPTGGGYECHLQAVCLPVAADDTARGNTLDEAKTAVEEGWGNLVAVIAMTLQSKGP